MLVVGSWFANGVDGASRSREGVEVLGLHTYAGMHVSPGDPRFWPKAGRSKTAQAIKGTRSTEPDKRVLLDVLKCVLHIARCYKSTESGFIQVYHSRDVNPVTVIRSRDEQLDICIEVTA